MSYTPYNDQQARANTIFNKLGGQTAALRVDWATRLKSIHAALVLNQLIFEARHHADDDGWFFLTADNMRECTAVAEKSYQSARTQLTKLGLLETKRAGVPAKTYIRMRWDAVNRWIDGDESPGSPSDRAEQDPPEGGTVPADRRNSNLPEAELLRESKTRANNEKDASTDAGSNLIPQVTAKPLPANGPEQQVVKAFYESIGVSQPPNYAKAIGQAKTLLKMGVDPSEIPAMVEWAKGQWFAKDGFNLADLAKFAENYRTSSASSAPTPAPDRDLTQDELKRWSRFTDWHGIYEPSSEGHRQWQQDYFNGTLRQRRKA